jgi:hypothetical protein
MATDAFDDTHRRDATRDRRAIDAESDAKRSGIFPLRHER